MTSRSPTALTPRIRFVISVLVVGHLSAVILPPLSFQARGPVGVSPAVDTAMIPIHAYSQALYLDRGYAFFAPDPGPSHLIQAAITAPGGSVIERMFPDLDDHRPRLMYHRHFMLSEFLTEIYHPPGPPPGLAEIDREEAENWRRSRARYEHVRQSIIGHLETEYPGQEVAIRRIEHLIPDLISFRESPIPINAPESYRVMLDNPIGMPAEGPSQNLVAPLQPPESIPAPPQNEPQQSPQNAPEMNPRLFEDETGDREGKDVVREVPQ